jgi:uncharacterized repeat protein (TIGR01451 family)
LVGNSYDPNDKVVQRPDFAIQFFGTGTEYIAAELQEDLTYTIRFQNTGTAPAQNIYIIDTLDSDLDWSSFTLIQASHNMQVVNLGNGIMRFEFPNIWLADSTTNEPASHGQLVYRILENATNTYGTEIENTAYIYFDWNAPIITNTTYNFNNLTEGISEGSTQNILVYPNPTNESITISCDGNFIYQLVDISGRLIATGEGMNTEKVNIEKASAGIYQLNVQTNKGNSSLKVMKQ